MPKFDKESLRKGYEEVCPKYERLAKNLREALEIFLDEKGIDYVGVFYRVKEFDSFWDKMRRKGYSNPFEQIEDICGLRVVCLYVSDMDKVKEIISKEFDVIKWIDKRKELKPYEFGYLSLHAIVTVKKDWLNAPNYRGLDGVKAEIQIRTTLMHAWGEVEHKLQYKEEGVVPDKFRRKFYQLSAQLESIDDDFDALRKDREEFKEAMVEEAKKSGEFDVNQPLNIDSLQAYLDFYSPRRIISSEETDKLLVELTKFKISIRELVRATERLKDILPRIDREMNKRYWEEAGLKSKGRSQVGMVRLTLDLVRDDYWASCGEGRETPWSKTIKEWRKKIAEREL